MRRWQLAAFVLLIATAVTAVWAWRRPQDPLRPLLRVDMDLGSDVSLSAAQGQEVVISPDGNRLVYVSNGRLFSRLLDRGTVAELKGTDGGFAPFFAPDGRAIAFFAGKELKTLTFDSGFVTKVCDTGARPKSGTWGDNGNIVADLNLGNTLFIVPASGGMPVPLTKLDENKHDIFHTMPFYLPGSDAVLFTAFADNEKTATADLRVISTRTRETKTLHAGVFARFVATSPSIGFLLFLDGTTIFASRFDMKSLAVTSTPTPILTDVLEAQLDVSVSGRAVAETGAVSARRDVVIDWMTPNGVTPLVTKPGVYRRPAVSPDGRRVAFQIDSPSGSDSLREAWIYDTETKSTSRLTFDNGEMPHWSPDGRHIAYHNAEGIFWIKSDGTGGSVKLTNGQNQFPFAFTPDGRALLFQQTVSSKNDIFLVRIPDGPISQPLTPEVVVQGPFDERQPTVSPDGKWLAYASDDTGEYQVYVRPFPNVNGGKWQISAEGGLLYPTWSRSENRLLFRNTGNQLFSSTYAVQDGAFVSQPPTLWSEQRLADLGLAGAQNFDLAPDGRRVAAIVPAPGPGGDGRRHTVVLLDNFVDELQRRVPQR